MDKLLPDITGIALALIGLATLTVLITGQNTVPIITASTSGFSGLLQAAMGGSRGGFQF